MATRAPEDHSGGRLPLDRLIHLAEESQIPAGNPRKTGLRETSAHVNPLMLAAAEDRSAYVEAWRDHAARCPACRQMFEYFGISIT